MFLISCLLLLSDCFLFFYSTFPPRKSTYERTSCQLLNLSIDHRLKVAAWTDLRKAIYLFYGGNALSEDESLASNPNIK